MAPDTLADNLVDPGSVVSHHSPENGSSVLPTASGPGTTSIIRKGTGPRTQEGKGRTKNNAVKHGIFSKAVVLKGEPQIEFKRLLNGLRDSLQPVGMTEELLVEKLAALFWRNRRLLIAEGAEIRARSEFIQWDGKERQRQAFPLLALISSGLLPQIAVPDVLQRCLELLTKLKESLEDHDFNFDNDTAILIKLYGRPNGNFPNTLFDSYLSWFKTSLASDEERQQEGFATPQQSKDNFLNELKREIKRLGRYKKEKETILSAKLEVELLRQNVPDAPQLDRLLRYETSVERSIERTLNQLERIQRMRLGQPVPPPINLNITASKE